MASNAASALVHYALPTQTYSAGSRSTQTLRDLPKTLFGKLCHLSKIVYSVILTPTYTAAPTTVGHNNFFSAADFWDGSIMRFQGGFNHLRVKERMQTGHVRLSDATTNAASTNSRVFTRVLHMGPPQFSNAPSDFVIPTGALENGELRFSHAALTDFSTDTTAATGSCRVTAGLMLLDEIRIPPAYVYVNQATTAGDTNLAGRALYESLALVTGSTFAAWTNGQIGNVRVDLGQGDFVGTIKSYDLARSFRDDFNAGEIGAVTGEPEVATYDTNEAIINRGANPATALATPANDLAPVLWASPGSRISKLPLAESVCRVRWDGSQGTGTLVLGRILPQPPTVVAAMLGKALGRLNLKASAPKIKTSSKVDYKGDKAEFMPWKVSIA